MNFCTLKLACASVILYILSQGLLGSRKAACYLLAEKGKREKTPRELLEYPRALFL